MHLMHLRHLRHTMRLRGDNRRLDLELGVVSGVQRREIRVESDAADWRNLMAVLNYYGTARHPDALASGWPA